MLIIINVRYINKLMNLSSEEAKSGQTELHYALTGRVFLIVMFSCRLSLQFSKFCGFLSCFLKYVENKSVRRGTKSLHFRDKCTFFGSRSKLLLICVFNWMSIHSRVFASTFWGSWTLMAQTATSCGTSCLDLPE